MIPIDGEKLKEVINELRCIAESQEEDIYQSGYLRALGALSEDIFIFKRAEFPPGTLIIQREEGYEKRECGDCFHQPRCLNEVYRRDKDCKWHLKRDELNAAYIVGGVEK